MTTPIRRRIEFDRKRSVGFVFLVIGGGILALALLQIFFDPSRWTALTQLPLGLFFVGTGALNLHRHRRQIAELEAEHGAGAGKQQTSGTFIKYMTARPRVLRA